MIKAHQHESRLKTPVSKMIYWVELSEWRVIITHVPNTLKYTENAEMYISAVIQLLWSSTLQSASQPQDLIAVEGPNLQIRQDAPARGPDYNLILEFSNSTKSSTKARRTCAALRAQTPAGSSGWDWASRADRSQRKSEPAPRPDPHHRSPSHTSRTGSAAPHWHSNTTHVSLNISRQGIKHFCYSAWGKNWLKHLH